MFLCDRKVRNFPITVIGKFQVRNFPIFARTVEMLSYFITSLRYLQKTQQILRGNEDEVFVVEIPDTQNTPDFKSESGNECGMESFEIEMFWSSGF